MGSGGSKQQETPQHRSLNSRHPAVGYFYNASAYKVRCDWLDYRGRPKPGVVLEPGQTYRQESYCCHPWRFVAEEGEAILVSKGQQVVYLEPGDTSDITITVATAVPWSPTTHAQFPPDFRQQALTLLMCHAQSGQEQQQQLDSRVQKAMRPRSRGLALNLASRLHGSAPKTGGAGTVMAGAKTATAPPAPGGTTLASLPMDVLLGVIQLAAPYVPQLVKPSFPPGAEEGDFNTEERHALFSN